MTDSFHSKSSRSSRKKHRREPAVIDGTATVLDEGRSADEAAGDAQPDNPGDLPGDLPGDAPGETERLVSEAMAEPETPIAAGSVADSVASVPPPAGDETVTGAARESGTEPEPGRASDGLSPAPEADGFGAAAEPPPPPPPPPLATETPRGPSTGALLGAGLIGGIVGAGLLYGLQTWQGPVGQQAPVPDDQRLAQLEQRVSALGQPADTAALDKRLKALEEARASFDQRLQAAQGAAEQAAAQAKDAATQAKDAREAASQPAPPQPAPQDETAVKDLTTRVASLEEKLQAQEQAVQAQDKGAKEAADAARAAQQAVDGLGGRLADSDQRLAALADQVKAQASKGPDETTLAAIRIALASRVSDALGRGAPYAGALSALKNVPGEADRLAPLEPFAEKGAPTAADLARSFKPLGVQILREDQPASGELTDRVWHMLDKVVTIRPVDRPGSDSVPSLVARIEQALDRGDVKAAVAAWETLPEPARRLSEDWARQAKARLAAEDAARSLSDDALSALNRPTQQ